MIALIYTLFCVFCK